MMPVEMSMNRVRAAAIIGAGALTLAGCSGGAGVATGSGYGSNLMFDTLSGVALIPKEQEPIDYSPRTGLVMPAEPSALPAPQDERIVTNPDWPQDESNRGSEGALAGLTPREQRRSVFARIVSNGGVRGNDNARALNDRNADIEVYDRFRKEMKTARARIDERRGRALDASGTPTRRYLTDPPLTYRQPATVASTDGEIPTVRTVQREPEKRGLRRFLPF
ncbi:MAG: hypothetical protein AAF321_11065 [Pseudomonadota bacterium]